MPPETTPNPCRAEAERRAPGDITGDMSPANAVTPARGGTEAADDARERRGMGFALRRRGGHMKHIVLSLFAVLVVVTSTSTPASADTVAGPPGSNVTVYTPKGWKTEAAEQNGNALLVAGAPKDDAALLYAVITAKDAEAAMSVVDGVIALMVKDIVLEKGGATKVSGMPALALKGSGTAVDGGKPVTFGAVIVQTSADHVLFAVALAHADRAKAYAKEFKKALAGIKQSGK
jgi:hypothetical protein